MDAPDKIFLQACGSCPLEGDECKVCKFEELEEITWNTERVFKKDVEYIRKEAILEWAKEMQNSPLKNTTESADRHRLSKMIIDKISSL